MINLFIKYIFAFQNKLNKLYLLITMEVDNPQVKSPIKKTDPDIPGLKGTGKDMDPILIQQKMLACDDASQLVEYQWPLEGMYSKLV